MKNWIQIQIAILLTLIGSACSAWAADKPNVVVFFMDDLDFSGMAEGYDLMQVSSSERLEADEPDFPVIVTPHTNKLVEQSLLFDQFFITSPVCTPSRFSLLTGKYASTAYNLKNDFEPGQSVHLIDWTPHVKQGQYTLPGMFRSAGYRTGIVGKLHCEDSYYKMSALYK